MAFNVTRLKKLKTNDLRVLTFLQNRPTGVNSIESYEKIGVHRLSASVLRLRKAGHDIQKEMVPMENRFGEKTNVARYFIAQ